MQRSKLTNEVFEFAKAEAQKQGHSCLQFMHVVYGIIKHNASVTAQVLEDQGLKLEVLRQEMKEYRCAENISNSSYSIVLSKIMDWAQETAIDLGSPEICPAHIVLAALDLAPAWQWSIPAVADLWENRDAIIDGILAGLKAKESKGVAISL